MEVLLQHGADWSVKDGAGCTALHRCVARDRDTCAKLLIRRGAAVHVPVRPARYCPPRHPTHFEPSFIGWNANNL